MPTTSDAQDDMEKDAMAILEAVRELYNAQTSTSGRVLSVPEAIDVLSRVGQNLFGEDAEVELSVPPTAELNQWRRPDGKLDFGGFIGLLCASEPWRSYIPLEQRKILLQLSNNKKGVPLVPKLPKPPTARPSARPPAPPSSKGTTPSATPRTNESQEILNGLQGWCLATGSIVGPAGRAEELPDLKLKFERKKISGHCSYQDERGAIRRGACKGLVAVKAGSEVSISLTEDYGEVGRLYSGTLRLRPREGKGSSVQSAFSVTYKGTVREMYSQEGKEAFEFESVLVFGTSLWFAAMMKVWLRRGNIVSEDIDRQALRWEADPDELQSMGLIQRFEERYACACDEYLIEPLPSVMHHVRQSQGKELKLEYCAGRLNDGQLFAVALGLWNLTELDCIRIAHAASVTDIGARVLSESLGLCESLRTLEISFTKISNAGAKVLSRALSRAPGLTHLNLQSNGISDAGAQALAEMITEHTQLTELKLGNGGGGKSGIWDSDIDESLPQSRYCRLICQLFSPLAATNLSNYQPEDGLHNCIGDQGAIALAHAIQISDRFTMLDLLGNPIGVRGSLHVIEMLQESSSMQHLSVNCWWNEECQLDEKCLNTLLHALESPHCAIDTLDLGLVHIQTQQAQDQEEDVDEAVQSIMPANDLMSLVSSKVMAKAPKVKYEYYQGSSQAGRSLTASRASAFVARNNKAIGASDIESDATSKRAASTKRSRSRLRLQKPTSYFDMA